MQQAVVTVVTNTEKPGREEGGGGREKGWADMLVLWGQLHVLRQAGESKNESLWRWPSIGLHCAHDLLCSKTLKTLADRRYVRQEIKFAQ